jgi:hypothetical protein
MILQSRLELGPPKPEPAEHLWQHAAGIRYYRLELKSLPKELWSSVFIWKDDPYDHTCKNEHSPGEAVSKKCFPDRL